MTHKKVDKTSKSPSLGGVGEASKYLIIQQKMIGDVLTSSILCEAIKKKNPAVEIHYLVNAHTVPVVENHPFIDKLVIVTHEAEKNIFRFFKLAKQLKAENYDVVIDVYSKPSSIFIGNYTGAKIKIGYKKWYSQLAYTHLYSYKAKADTYAGLAVENRMLLLQALDKNYPKSLKPKIYLTETEITSAKTLIAKANLKKENPIFMIGAMGSSKEKSYPLPYLAKLLDILVEKTQADLLFNYLPTQLPEIEKLLQLCTEKTQKKVHLSIYGKGLRGFFGLLSQCDALIANEGGAVNMAKALEIPTFSIFSPFIKKEAWSLFEDVKNVSVHLKDYEPEHYEKHSLEEIKKDAQLYYKKLKPEYIAPNFLQFITNYTS